jgi:23S rRNA pseudouridine1911/1915/1917 synthase
LAHAFSSESFPVEGETPLPLERILKDRHAAASWRQVRTLIESGKTFVDATRVTSCRALVSPGSTVRVHMNAPREPKGYELADELVLYHDRDVVVVNKPIGLSSMTHEGETNSTDRLVADWLSRKTKRSAQVHVVHRLDKVTSGVLVFACTRDATLALKEQFRAHTVGRHYFAIAHGHLRDRRLSFRIVRDRGDGLRGVTREPGRGVHSVTDVQVLEQFARCALVRCRLETGRTHQIRIHLAQIGSPLVGEPLYTLGLQGPFLDAPRVMLHAAHLSFGHPRTRARLSFDSPLPEAFEQFLNRERKRAG